VIPIVFCLCTYCPKGLQTLRAEREQTQSDIEALEAEKKAIQHILPKVLHELSQIREDVEHKTKEMQLYDSAIAEIEKTSGHVIYSASMFHPANA
jgi:uncharacterized protein YoxC